MCLEVVRWYFDATCNLVSTKFNPRLLISFYATINTNFFSSASLDIDSTMMSNLPMWLSLPMVTFLSAMEFPFSNCFSIIKFLT